MERGSKREARKEVKAGKGCQVAGGGGASTDVVFALGATNAKAGPVYYGQLNAPRKPHKEGREARLTE